MIEDPEATARQWTETVVRQRLAQDANRAVNELERAAGRAAALLDDPCMALELAGCAPGCCRPAWPPGPWPSAATDKEAPMYETTRPPAGHRVQGPGEPGPGLRPGDAGPAPGWFPDGPPAGASSAPAGCGAGAFWDAAQTWPPSPRPPGPAWPP